MGLGFKVYGLGVRGSAFGFRAPTLAIPPRKSDNPSGMLALQRFLDPGGRPNRLLFTDKRGSEVRLMRLVLCRLLWAARPRAGAHHGHLRFGGLGLGFGVWGSELMF